MLGKVSLTRYIIAKAYGGERHDNKVDGFQLAPALHVGEHEGRSEDKEQTANQQEEHCRQNSHQPRGHTPLLWERVVDRAIEMPVTYSSLLAPRPSLLLAPRPSPLLARRVRGSCSLGVHTHLPGKKTLRGAQRSSPRRLLRCGRCPGAERSPAGPRLPPAASRTAGSPPVHRRYKRDARHLCVRLCCRSLDREGSAGSPGATRDPRTFPHRETPGSPDATRDPGTFPHRETPCPLPPSTGRISTPTDGSDDGPREKEGAAQVPS